MKIVSLILASGEGSRLYPLSKREKPKQFLKLLNDKTMLENTIDRFEPYVQNSFVVTLNRYRELVWNLGPYPVVFEEEKRETAVSAYEGLKAIMDFYPQRETIIIQSPSDHYIEGAGFDTAIKEGIEWAKKGYTAIIGVEPRDSETDYGYTKEEGKKVHFIQKPNKLIAKKLIENGYSWNTAIYIYPLHMMWAHYKDMDFQYQEEYFETLVLQEFPYLKVVKGKFDWSDIGNFTRLHEVTGGEADGERTTNETNS